MDKHSNHNSHNSIDRAKFILEMHRNRDTESVIERLYNDFIDGVVINSVRLIFIDQYFKPKAAKETVKIPATKMSATLGNPQNQPKA